MSLSICRLSTAKRYFDANQMDAKLFVKELTKVVELFDSAMVMLEPEEEGSYAHDLFKRARQNRLETRDVIRFAEFLG